LFKATFVLALASALLAQFRGSSDWSTNGGDAHRSSWVRADPKISPARLAQPGFELVWKLKLNGGTNQPALTAPVLLDRYIGYRGFRTYAFVGGTAENAFALDSDLGRIEWQKHFPIPATAESGNCPGGMTAELARPLSTDFPSTTAGRFGGTYGRGGPAKSAVGEPLQGAVTLEEAANRSAAAPRSANGPQAKPAPAPSPRRFAPRPTFLFALSGDGTFHRMYVSNGQEPEPPVKFLPPNANVSDLSVVDDIAYATTINHCAGVPDGVWALDLSTKAVTSWQGSLTGGETAFAPSENTYLTSGDKLLALDRKTLAPGASVEAGQPFSTPPLVFEYQSKTMIAAATKDGVLHLFNSASLANPGAQSAAGHPDPYALASWQTAAETRRIIVTGPKSITTWKIVDKDSRLTLLEDWSVHNVSSPANPLIVNGVLFALERGDSNHNSLLYAFDASTGKQLWTSGTTITSFVPKSGGLAAGGSSIYFGTEDGTLWDFGFPIEH
jgi:outer membrane protein assembly factor BamB